MSAAPAPEFSRLVRLDGIGETPRDHRITADAAERAALARRFDLPAIERLDAEALLHRDGANVIAEGRLVAEVVQSCVATGDPIRAAIDAPFVLRFEPEGTIAGDELELAEADCDVMFYQGGAIDLGEAAAETLVLALDRFPRLPDADLRLREAGVLGEEDVGPFAALKGLRDQLKN